MDDELRNHFAVAALLLSIAAIPVESQQKQCSESQRARMETQSDAIRTWHALHRSFTTYKSCLDDVDAQEGYSESKARILADHWDTLPRLSALSRKDPAFGRWVMVDATMNMDDVHKIREKAIHHCPIGMTKICARLVKQADDAIAEVANVQK